MAHSRLRKRLGPIGSEFIVNAGIPRVKQNMDLGIIQTSQELRSLTLASRLDVITKETAVMAHSNRENNASRPATIPRLVRDCPSEEDCSEIVSIRGNWTKARVRLSIGMKTGWCKDERRLRR